MVPYYPLYEFVDSDKTALIGILRLTGLKSTRCMRKNVI